MNKEYKDLKLIIGKYKKIIVTGPHGAGNKICTKIISHDFNLKEKKAEYAWDLNEYDKDDGLLKFHKDNKDNEFISFAPSQSGHLHRIKDMLKDVLVVFMYKDMNSIERYTERNPFVKDQSHNYEWGVYNQMVMEDFPKSSGYLRKSIEQLTYHIWENHQRDLIPNWVEINHSSLEGHELWISKEDRKEFKEWQTTF